MRCALVVLIAWVLSACQTAMAPRVAPPSGPAASMLVLRAHIECEGEKGLQVLREQRVDQGWYPLVQDEEGRPVVFTVIADAALGPIYIAGDLAAGRYILTGWRYTWMNEEERRLTPVASRQLTHQPAPWQQVDRRLLPDESSVVLDSGSVASLGVCSLRYRVVAAADPLAEDRLRITGFGYSGIDPDDRLALERIATWSSPAWDAWNLRNPLAAITR